MGHGRCLWQVGGLPRLLVWDREGCLHAGRGRPTHVYAGFCGQLKLDWYFCATADPQAKGAVQRLQGYMESNFEPGRRFANHLDFQLQLDAWLQKANARTHKALRARPIDRLNEERQVMRELPEQELNVDRRLVTRVPPDPHVRVDTNDYSLDPRLVGRRVEVVSHSARSRRWRSTPASSLARTSAASPRTARSLLWSTPGTQETPL